MDHTKIEEEQVAERYVMGRLSVEEAERFEEHYLTCNPCLDRLQLAERFHHALRGMAAEDTARATGLGFLAFLARLARWQRGLLVTGLLLAIALPTLQWARLAGERQALVGPRGISAFLPLSPVRSTSPGEEPAAQLTLGSDSELVVLTLDATAARGRGAVRITVLDPSGETLWRGPPTVPDPADQLHLTLSTDLLAEGDYELRLEAAESGEPVGTPYRFRVLRRDLE